jgi:hypothetical protein
MNEHLCQDASLTIEIGIPFFCPVCGSSIDIVDDSFRYCPHVEFVFGGGAEPNNFWIYVSEYFATSYLKNEMAKVIFEESECDDKHDSEFNTRCDEAISLFISRKFEPGSHKVALIPLKLDKVKRTLGKKSVLFEINAWTYSRVYVGIKTY